MVALLYFLLISINIKMYFKQHFIDIAVLIFLR